MEGENARKIKNLDRILEEVEIMLRQWSRVQWYWNTESKNEQDHQ